MSRRAPYREHLTLRPLARTPCGKRPSPLLMIFDQREYSKDAIHLLDRGRLVLFEKWHDRPHQLERCPDVIFNIPEKLRAFWELAHDRACPASVCRAKRTLVRTW